MEIWCLSVRARPAKEHPEFDGVRGAYVNCWVRASTAAEAQRIAIAEINNEGWVIEEIERTPETEFPRTEANADYLLKAQLDGECYVYHTYMRDEDEDQIH